MCIRDKLTMVPNKTTEQIATAYTVVKDVEYGSDADQKMDVYFSKDAKSYGKKDYTIVFLHGGGYYLSDKSQEEKFIEPYLKKRSKRRQYELPIEKVSSDCNKRLDECIK